MNLRDDKRYGKFKASSNLGEIIIDINICGWGDSISIYKDKECIAYVDTIEDEEDYEEDEISITIMINDYEYIEVYKPFIKCLKIYE